ncbi:MAG: ATP-dependent DNA helicase [Candidatus Izemoplasmatales bacterium]|nr:ATP-dependent DNA helicase [Candidatus Izemoplasmatales bacterium]
MKEYRTSAKEIAELLFGSGDITSDRVMTTRANEGLEIHQYWQSLYGPDDAKEVFVRTVFERNGILLDVTGRIDGILAKEEGIVLEEIKSTRLDFEYLEEDTYPAHSAQAKLYAYMYMLEKGLKKIKVVLTYIQVEDRTVQQFEKSYTLKVLESYYTKTIGKYLDWVEKVSNHEDLRMKSMEGLKFPFDDYRLNQRELMAHVYRNTLDEGILYATAPTGIGKTIATMFASLKAIHDPREKIFYATAKNDGKVIALDTIRLLEKNGLIAKTSEITAKDSMCLLKERDCDPETCKYAKGYYKRVYKAIDDLFENESIFSKEIMKLYGRKHKVCPFEYSLDASNYSDVIVCDYNYVFDPRVHLIRYFEEDKYRPIVLVDEAHNMISRSREMYSATIREETLKAMLDVARYLKPNPKREVQRVLDYFQEIGVELLLEVDFTMKDTMDDVLFGLLKRLLAKFDQILSGERKIPMKSTVLDLYFEVYQFVKITEFFNQEYVFLYERIDNHIQVSMKCLNAAGFLKETMNKHTVSTTLFSATLDPIHYYKTLLSGGEGKDVKMPSPFKQNHLLLLAVDDVSTRYNDRNDSIEKIVSVTKTLVRSKKGNYIVFFPSYQYLSMVKEKLDQENLDLEILEQKREMSLLERSETLTMFKTQSDKTQVGLFVMGGVFGESIDLIGDMLSGVVIVGVGLPQLSNFNNILRSHFDLEFQSGFDYAYTFPGLNKVIQAVGRVIRSESDRGVAILIDDRFTSNRYYGLYPKEWSHLRVVNEPERIERLLDRFWKEGEEQ